MASRRDQLAFTLERFKGFWNQYKRSKRGLLGIVIIIIFGVLAIFAPFLSPLDPLEPKWPGGWFPGGEQPKQAEKLCVPIWYKSILGMNQLSENLEVVEDPEFRSPDELDQWDVSYDPQYASVSYSDTGGNHDKDGYVHMTYRREAGEEVPEGGKSTIVLAKTFVFPYANPPKSFWWHFSVFVENKTTLPKNPIEIRIMLRRGNEPNAIVVRNYLNIAQSSFLATSDERRWYSSKGTTLGEQDLLEETVFTGSGNYTYEFRLSVVDSEQSSDLIIGVDNLQMILYGEAFGLLGTSSFPEVAPRDLFTMLLYGTRISFMIGLLTAVFSVLIGLVVGLVSGYVGGLVDEGLMRFADFLLVLPGLPLLIVLVTVLGRSIWNIMGVLVFMGWMGFSRSVRSMVLSLRERPFIESAKAAGASKGYVIFRHILPNVFALVYISLATSVPGAIISEASLAWLGLGDIDIPSWGIMLYDFSRTQTAVVKGLGEYWFWVLPPGIAIALMAMAFILMGFSLDEILNPKLRKRQ
jgi:ABC-type dipeptide/oligopeptide/nickel transport system permease subunit